jgi:hypothetical protein
VITLFDKVTGSYDSFDSSGITDSTASFTKNEFKDWYIKIGSGGVMMKLLCIFPILYLKLILTR